MRLLAVLLVCVSLFACKTTSSTPGGVSVLDVSAETKNDIAACSMGISSGVELKVGASIEKTNGGELTGSLKDELHGAFVSKFGQADALKAQTEYLACMNKRYEDRKAEKKISEISACKAAVTCDVNVVAGICSCRHVVEEAEKKYGWSPAKVAQEYNKLCLQPAKIEQCWPANAVLKSARARCESVLGDAKLALPSLNSDTCSVTPVKSLS